MKLEGANLIFLTALSTARIDATLLSWGHYQFPELFRLGAATASYQIEGGWNENGKTEYHVAKDSHTTPSW
jgi:hypothetical protein